MTLLMETNWFCAQIEDQGETDSKGPVLQLQSGAPSYLLSWGLNWLIIWKLFVLYKRNLPSQNSFYLAVLCWCGSLDCVKQGLRG